MKHKKMIIPAITLAALGLVSFVGIRSIDAKGYGYSPMAEKIAEKFNLNSGEVEAVFEANRAERREQMGERQEERLVQAVLDGKITEEQKQAILAKKAEMQVDREQMLNLPDQEREANREKHQEEMKIWAEENGIDMAQFMGMGGGFGNKGSRQGMGR